MEKIEYLNKSEFIPVLITLIDPNNKKNTRDIKGFIFAQTGEKYYVKLDGTYITDDGDDDVFNILLEDMRLSESKYGLNKILVYKTPMERDSYSINIQGDVKVIDKDTTGKEAPNFKGGSKKRRPQKIKKKKADPWK